MDTQPHLEYGDLIAAGVESEEVKSEVKEDIKQEPGTEQDDPEGWASFRSRAMPGTEPSGLLDLSGTDTIFGDIPRGDAARFSDTSASKYMRTQIAINELRETHGASDDIVELVTGLFGSFAFQLYTDFVQFRSEHLQADLHGCMRYVYVYNPLYLALYVCIYT